MLLDQLTEPVAAEFRAAAEVKLRRDFNGDGKSDVVVRDPSTAHLQLHRGNGLGGWSGSGQIGGNGWNAFDIIISAGDFSGDGRPGVIARESSTQDLRLYEGNGTGGFKAGTGAYFSYNWGNFDRILSAGDFNGDGKADLLARSAVTRDLTYTPATALADS